MDAAVQWQLTASGSIATQNVVTDANRLMDTIFESPPHVADIERIDMAYHFSFRNPHGDTSSDQFIRTNWMRQCDIVVYDANDLDSLLAAATLKIIYPRATLFTQLEIILLEAQSCKRGGDNSVDDLFRGKNVILLHMYVFVPFRSTVFAGARSTFFIGSDARLGNVILDSVNTDIIRSPNHELIVPRVIMCCTYKERSVTNLVWHMHSRCKNMTLPSPFFVKYASGRSWNSQADQAAVTQLAVDMARNPVELIKTLILIHYKHPI